MCKCLDGVNAGLKKASGSARNPRIATQDKDGVNRALVTVSEAGDVTDVVGGIMAAYCPFCGQKYGRMIQ